MLLLLRYVKLRNDSTADAVRVYPSQKRAVDWGAATRWARRIHGQRLESIVTSVVSGTLS